MFRFLHQLLIDSGDFFKLFEMFNIHSWEKITKQSTELVHGKNKRYHVCHCAEIQCTAQKLRQSQFKYSLWGKSLPMI